MKLYCKACGGGLADGDERCGLCGTPAGIDPDQLTRVAYEEDPSQPAPAAVGGPFCNSCGWQNPAGARFCSKCGAQLQVVDTGGTSTGAAPPRAVQLPPETPTASGVEEGVGKRVGIIVGAAVMVVLALYMISALAADSEVSGPQPAVPLQSDAFAPVPPGIAQRIEVLDDSLQTLSGLARQPVLQRKVELYVGAGRYDLAGEAQEALAQVTGEEIDWTFAGNLFYDAMDRAAEASDARTGFAKRAIAAYQEVLRINPDNLDVRTDMAVAYLYDPDNPMSAIQETQAVLARDSLHVQANFNRGIMLLQINRVDQALSQFRKVQRIVGDPANPIYQRAQDAIDQVSGGR